MVQFVLLLRSCFSRVAYALATGRKGRPPPVISLEAPWSPWRAAKGGKMGRLRAALGPRSGRGREPTRRAP